MMMPLNPHFPASRSRVMEYRSARVQVGGTVLGIVIGILIGLSIALLLAVYVSNMPLPFVNRGTLDPSASAEEQRKNKDWDPNAPLQAKQANEPIIRPKVAPTEKATADEGAKKSASSPTPTPEQLKKNAANEKEKAKVEDTSQNDKPAAADALDLFVKDKLRPSATPASKASSSAESDQDPFLYFVQIGAFVNAEEAQAQRARAALLGFEAGVSEREQAGRLVHRVRLGPLSSKEAADKSKAQLQANGLEGVLVRVAR